MNLTVVRFALRRQRLELVLFSLILLTLAALASWVALSIFRLHLADCYVEPARATAEECARRSQRLGEVTGAMPVVQGLAVFVPPVAGLFLGATVVSREVEAGTAMFAWSFGLSRTRWLLARVVPVALIVVVLAVAAGAAVDAVYAAAYPYLPLESNLVDFQLRGPLLAARALLAFAASLLIGAISGRLLPALLLSLVLCGALVGGSMALANEIAGFNPVVEPGPGSIITGTLFQTPDGELIDGTEAVRRLPSPNANLSDYFMSIDTGIPGSRSPFIVGSITLLSSLVAVTLIGLSLLVIDRRRPY